MMVLEELFPTLKDFQELVSGTDTSDSFVTLNSAALSARKDLTSIITPAIYKAILKEGGDLKLFLQLAVGNCTMMKDAVFNVLRRRKNDVDLYKHEMEAMRDAYIDNYYNALDSLIACLEDQEEDKLGWQKTPYCKLRSTLRIKSTEEFNLLYPIENSYLFFFRTIPLQKEVLDDTLSNYYLRAADKEDLTEKLNRALAQLTVATAIRRFDIQELPVTIRNLQKEGTTQRQSSGEQSRLLKLAADLANNVEDILKSIEVALAEPANNNVETQTSFNRPDDKIYLMS